ncbi:MAG TPA: dihydrolipoamide acetyltransferase family protein [Conexibacter sp.]|jgi:pyruvate dehydrogenase E2 component (dihydrolipoamide acetyltransferase)|nr:dihydrolipoamide acetyltransferase family protein [Conexibacter sp.]
MTPAQAANAVAIAMPRLSDSMEEATILAWLKAPGDAVRAGEALVEIETDKATMVYEAEQDGVLGALLVGEGEVAALGAPIAELLVEGGSGRRVPATPVARRVAAELGVALEGIAGRGPRGRIVRADVLAAAERGGTAAAPSAGPAPIAATHGDDHVALTATQRTVARRMVASRSEIPEFTLTAEIDMTDALALRRELNALAPEARVSVNDLVVKAAALVLREQPALNASWAGDHVVRHGRVNVGVAVATDDALLVPVVTDADRRSLPELATAARAAGERARARASTPEELSGGTFTVTNLGMFGVLSFDAVIDAPQVAILAVGGVVRRPAYDEQGDVVPRDLMHVSLCSDHRAVYGADAARFLQRLRELLERPVALLVPAADNEETKA